MRPCPICKERIQDAALKCRFCGAEFAADDVEKLNLQKSKTRTGLLLACLAVVGACVYSAKGPDDVGYVASPNPIVSEPVVKRAVEVKWSWQDEGYGYCKAQGNITNNGDVVLRNPKIHLEFMSGEKIVGSSFSYAEVKSLGPGETSLWDDMFDCPDRSAKARLSVTASGYNVAVSE